MRRTVQKTLALLLCLVLLLGLMPAALAEESDGAPAEELLEVSPVDLPEEELAAEAEIPEEGTETLAGPIPEELIELRVNPLYAGEISESELQARLETAEQNSAITNCASFDQVVTAFREGMQAREENIRVCYTGTESISYSDAFDQAMEHNGDPTAGDYLQWQWEGAQSSYQGGVFCLTMAYYTSAQQEQELDAAVNQLLDSLDLYNEEPYEKILGVYDYVCSHVTYDYDNLYDDSYGLKRTAYAALMNGTAVCQGYAVLLYRLLLSLDVDCRVVASVDHSWNIVRLGDVYYNVDATWDSGPDPSHVYFLRNMEHFRDPHHERTAPYDGEDFAAAYPMSPTDYPRGSGLIQVSPAELSIQRFGEPGTITVTTDPSLGPCYVGYRCRTGCASVSYCAENTWSVNPCRPGMEILEFLLFDAESNEILGSAEVFVTVTGFRVAVVTDGGPVNDEAFNQAAYGAAADFCAGNDLDLTSYVPTDPDQLVSTTGQAIADGCDVLILPGMSAAESIAALAPDHPEVMFLGLDLSETDLHLAGLDEIPENVECVSYKEEQAGFLAGYAAVKLGYTRLGFLGGMAVPAVVRYGYGFIQGADFAARELNLPDTEIKFAYANQFFPDDRITEAMEGWFEDGTQVVFACGGGIGNSVAQAAGTCGGRVIGVDVDQANALNAVAGENVTLTSAMKGIGAAVTDYLYRLLYGMNPSGMVTRLGIEYYETDRNYVQLATSTQWSESFNETVYADLVAGILEGNVLISDDWMAEPESMATAARVLVIDDLFARPTAEIYGFSITTTGSIGLNLYLALPEELTADEDAYVIFGDETQLIAQADTTQAGSQTLYKFTALKAAPDMDEPVSLRVFTGSGRQVPLYNQSTDTIFEDGITTSIKDYLNAVSGSSNQNLAGLARAMADDGVYAHAFFREEEKLPTVTGVTETDLAPYALVVDLQAGGSLSYYGLSLVVESSSVIRNYFRLDSGSIGDYCFTIDGTEATPVNNGGYWYVQTPGVPAAQLDTEHELLVTRAGEEVARIQFCGLSYCTSTLSYSGASELLRDLVKTIYLYNQAANLFFGS